MRLIAAVFCFAAVFAAAPAAFAQTPPTPPAPPAALPSIRPAPAAPTGLVWQRSTRATEVVLQNVAAYVRVRPEDREDVAFAIHNQGPLTAPTIRRSGRRLVIDGRQRGQIRDCTVRGAAGFEVETARQGRISGAQLPIIELRVPERAFVSVNGAARMHVTGADSAKIRLDGCGDVDIEHVEDEAEVSVSHDAVLRIYDAGNLTAVLAGESAVHAGVVRDALTVSIAGPGVFNAVRADGPTSVVIQGSGEASIRAGEAEDLSVVINGPGRVTHSGRAERLDAFIVGPGALRVRDVEGEVSRRVIGGGEVIVGR
jgi:hypothetical protein